MKGLNIDRIISENINKFVNNLIKESEFNYVQNANPTSELASYLRQVGRITLNLDGDFEFETPSYFWSLEYKIDPSVYYTHNSGSYYDEPSDDIHGADNFDFNVFELYCFTKDGDEVPFETTDEVVAAFRKVVEVDYDGYDMPSADEMYDDGDW